MTGAAQGRLVRISRPRITSLGRADPHTLAHNGTHAPGDAAAVP